MSHAIVSAVSASLMFLAGAAAHAVDTPGNGFFPFAVWYGGGKARAPMLEPLDATSRERWQADLRQIRALGFNAVRTWVEWTAGEPRPGEYRFEQLSLLAELAGEVGLKLLVQVYVDSAPDWVGERWPDARFVAQNGAAIPSQAAPGYCFDHDAVRRAILAFYEEAGRAASRHDNVIAWDVWSEPHIINWAVIEYVPNATFCYCPASCARFRRWLAEKYGSLDALNRAWYRTFTRWEQVEPPRFGTILSYTDFIDWRTFIGQKLAEDLRMRGEAVRAADPRALITSHAAVPCLFTSPLWGIGAPDDWLMAGAADYWGTSIYPKHSFPERHWDRQRLAVIADFIRSSGRSRGGFYVGEFQAGQGIRGTIAGNPVTAADHELWLWLLLSRGARAVNVYAYYPMSSGYEAGGYGLVELDGTPTERSRELGRLARVVDAHGALFAAARPPRAQVAIIYNPLAFLVGGEQHLSEAGAVRDSLTGIYRPFWRANVAVDFVHLREVEAGGLSGYRIVFLPYPLMLREAAALELRRYVEQGGWLVAEARCGWNDDRGYAQQIVPGFNLDELLGAREARLQMRERVEITLGEAGRQLAGAAAAGEPIVGRGIESAFTPYDGAEVLGSFGDGAAAIVSRSWGEGRAVIVGSFLGLANGQTANPQTEAFLLGLARAAGAEPVVPMRVEPPDAFVEARRLDAEAGTLLFLFNHGEREATVQLEPARGEELTSGSIADLRHLTLAPGATRVFRLR